MNNSVKKLCSPSSPTLQILMSLNEWRRIVFSCRIPGRTWNCWTNLQTCHWDLAAVRTACHIFRRPRRCPTIDWDTLPRRLIGGRGQPQARPLTHQPKPKPMPCWRWRIGSSGKRTQRGRCWPKETLFGARHSTRARHRGLGRIMGGVALCPDFIGRGHCTRPIRTNDG